MSTDGACFQAVRQKRVKTARHGFTLIELLVVVALIATLSFFLVGGLSGDGRSTALQSGQALVASLVTATRTKAPATGRKTRLLVAADPMQPERYLRFLVVQVAREPGASPVNWDTVQSVNLPAGVYLVPGSLEVGSPGTELEFAL